ncbi:MAG: hypothetical protein Q7J57_08495, partial [Gemmobacter sp.]|nr:hypothetical protein [Gemmobacter sp.]
LRFSETAFPHVVCSFRLGRLYITARELPGGRSSAFQHQALFFLDEALVPDLHHAPDGFRLPTALRFYATNACNKTAPEKR